MIVVSHDYDCGPLHLVPLPRRNLGGLSASIAVAIDDIIQQNRIINWQKNSDVQNRMKQKIEDLLFEELDKYNIELDFDEIDYILDKCVATAIIRLPDA